MRVLGWCSAHRVFFLLCGTGTKGKYRQYTRDIILGVNDGLVSMCLLIIGLVGGGLDSRAVLLAGIMGSVAGAISSQMSCCICLVRLTACCVCHWIATWGLYHLRFPVVRLGGDQIRGHESSQLTVCARCTVALGEYMATKSQSEVMAGDLALERDHFRHHRHIELDEVAEKLAELNLSGELLRQAVEAIGASDEALLKFMQAFEFGYTEQDERRPWVAMLTSGGLFLTGSLPSVVPFACTANVAHALWAAVVLCAAAMFAVGALKTVATRTGWLRSGLENLVIGALGAAVSFGIGKAYDAGQPI